MRIVGLVAAAALVGCGGPRATPVPPAPAPAEPDAALATDTLVAPAPVPEIPRTLYDRLGGEVVVAAIADDLVERVLADVRIKERFYEVDPDAMKQWIATTICIGADGACPAIAHFWAPNEDVIAEEVTAFLEAVVGALDKHGVREQEKAEVVAYFEQLGQAVVVPDDRLHAIDPKQLARVAAVAARLVDPDARALLVLAVKVAARKQRWY